MALVGWIFMMALGLVSFGLGLRMRRQVLEARKRPTVEGTVREKSVIPLRSTSAGNRTSRWEPYVRYSYEVDRVSFENDRLLPFNQGFTKTEAENYINGLGATVRVYYDERDPSQSCLEPGRTGPTWLAIGWGAAFFVFGALLTVVELTR